MVPSSRLRLPLAPNGSSRSSSACSKTTECQYLLCLQDTCRILRISQAAPFPDVLQLELLWVQHFSNDPEHSADHSVYAYQGSITSVLFNGRTRALVSLLTGLGSMTGSIIIGLLTDRLPFKRRNRAVVSCLIVFLFTAFVWGAGLGFQVKFTRADVAEGSILLGNPLPWDLHMASSAGGPITLLMACEFDPLARSDI